MGTELSYCIAVCPNCYGVNTLRQINNRECVVKDGEVETVKEHCGVKCEQCGSFYTDKSIYDFIVSLYLSLDIDCGLEWIGKVVFDQDKMENELENALRKVEQLVIRRKNRKEV